MIENNHGDSYQYSSIGYTVDFSWFAVKLAELPVPFLHTSQWRIQRTRENRLCKYLGMGGPPGTVNITCWFTWNIQSIAALKQFLLQWRIQDFPKWWRQPLKRTSTHYLTIFFWKLHENEEILAGRGYAHPLRPLDPPLYDVTISMNCKNIKLIERRQISLFQVIGAILQWKEKGCQFKI